MAHIHEKIDYTVEVFIVYKDKILLRKHDKYKIWMSVGGHIELDEDPEQAIIREAKEETGLDIDLVGAKPDFNDKEYLAVRAPRYVGRHYVDNIHQHVVFVYFAKSKNNIFKESILDHEKGVEMKWFTKETLNELELRPNIKFYALEALKELSMK
jgi:8-oxo-dGTP diphosphatase